MKTKTSQTRDSSNGTVGQWLSTEGEAVSSTDELPHSVQSQVVSLGYTYIQANLNGLRRLYIGVYVYIYVYVCNNNNAGKDDRFGRGYTGVGRGSKGSDIMLMYKVLKKQNTHTQKETIKNP